MELGLSLERAITARRAMDHVRDTVDGAQQKGIYEQALKRLPAKLASAVATLDMQRVQDALPKPLLLHKATLLLPLTLVGDVPVVEVLAEPLANDHADDWLLAEGIVSLRMLERQLIDLWIARLKTPDQCPVDIRLRDRLPLGTAIDEAYAEAAGSLASPEALTPLCRRERQRRLAHEAMAPRHTFPFAPGVLLDDVERGLLERLQKQNGLGGKARSLMYSMLQADEDLRAQSAALYPSAKALLGTLAVDAALKSKSLACAYAFSPNKLRLVASLFARFSSETFPNAPERENLITFLYALAALPVPDDGAISAPHIAELWTRVSLLPAGPACENGSAIAISDHSRAILANATLDEDKDMQ